MFVFFFQSPLPIYHISHQMSTAISSLTKNYISETIFQLSYYIICLYQNLTIKIITSTPTSTRHTYTRQPTLFCVCMSGLNYFNSQLTPAFCVRRELGLIYIPTWMHTGFVGQCDETSIYLLYTRIQGLQDWNNYFNSQCMASTRYSNNLLLYTHNKKYSKEFSKKA